MEIIKRWFHRRSKTTQQWLWLGAIWLASILALSLVAYPLRILVATALGVKS